MPARPRWPARKLRGGARARRWTQRKPSFKTVLWCERRDSNPHGVTHWNLNPARLPVPPLSPRPCSPLMTAALPQGARIIAEGGESVAAFYGTFPKTYNGLIRGCRGGRVWRDTVGGPDKCK